MTRYPIHTALLGIFPVIFLFARNVDETQLSETLLPILVILLAAAAVWAPVRLAVGDSLKAGLIVSLALVLFFSFGRFTGIICRWNLFGFHIGRPEYLAAVWVIVLVVIALALMRTRRDLSSLNRGINIFAVILVAISTATAAYGMLVRPDLDIPKSASRTLTGVPENRPDIFYIIVDGYGRGDILTDVYGFDNSDFTDYLRGRGFFVADSSTANYCQTYLSLASTFNMIHLDSVAESVGFKSKDRRPLIGMIKNNSVIDLLRDAGYRVVALSACLSGVEIENPDMLISASFVFSEFQRILLATTPLSFILKRAKSTHDYHRDHMLSTLENLAKAPDIDGPKFVYSHILAPHPPFVFDEMGKEVDPGHDLGFWDGSHYFDRVGSPERYRERYTAFAKWLNGMLVGTIDSIIARSDEPPVIILQADHGPGSCLYWEDTSRTDLAERLSILNAYLLPGECGSGLYSQITPVNTFRLLFDCYFNTDFGLLEDACYFATWDHPYRLINVTDRVHQSRSSEPSH